MAKVHETVRRRGMTLIELMVVVSIIGVLIGLLLPAVQSARESARRTVCANQLRQFGLAMSQHEIATKRFPTGGWNFRWFPEGDRGSTRKQPGGWLFPLLPYLEQKPLSDTLKNPPGGDRQAALRHLITTPIEIMYCPSRRAAELYLWQVHNVADYPFNMEDYPEMAAKLDYAANGGTIDPTTGTLPITLEQADNPLFPWQDNQAANGICYFRSEVKSSQVSDGTSNTFLMGEKWVRTSAMRDMGDDTSPYCGFDKDNVRWTNQLPVPDSEEEHWDQFGSPHPEIVQFVYVDGSVRPVTYTVDAEVFRCLGDRRDGEVPEFLQR